MLSLSFGERRVGEYLTWGRRFVGYGVRFQLSNELC